VDFIIAFCRRQFFRKINVAGLVSTDPALKLYALSALKLYALQALKLYALQALKLYALQLSSSQSTYS
jgi:hypothetical protein